MEKNMQHDKAMLGGHYGRLLLMTVLSFIAMYILMYAMVDRLGNVFNSVNQFYMAGLMTAPMVVLELLLMGSMYNDKKLNAILMGVGVLALAVCWTLIRQQSAVGDRQFLRSMIPHHGRDPDVRTSQAPKPGNPEALRRGGFVTASRDRPDENASWKAGRTITRNVKASEEYCGPQRSDGKKSS